MNFNYYGNYMPHQEIMRANGRESINNLKLAPNSSVLVLDTTAPLVWLCSSDGVGSVSATPYTISEYTEPESDIEKRLTAIEEQLKELNNAKSDVKKPKPKSNDE